MARREDPEIPNTLDVVWENGAIEGDKDESKGLPANGLPQWQFLPATLSPHYVFYGACALYVGTLLYDGNHPNLSHGSYLQVEIVCWCMLFVITKVRQYLATRTSDNSDLGTKPSTNDDEPLAVAIAAASLLPSFGYVRWAFPLLIPLLQTFGHEDPVLISPLQAPQQTTSKFSNVPRPALLRLTLVAVLCSGLLLSRANRLYDILPGLAWALCQFSMYWQLQDIRRQSDHSTSLLWNPLLRQGVLLRVIALLSLGLLMAPKDKLMIAPLLVPAFSRALAWQAVLTLVFVFQEPLLPPLKLQQVNLNHVVVTASLGVLAVGASDAFHWQHTRLYNYLALLVGLVGLVQTHNAIRNKPYSRRIASAIMALLLIAFHVRYLHLINSSPRKTRISRMFYKDAHPIEILVTEANRDFVDMFQRQSKTLAQAQAEYERRYRMSPPPGFDAWFDFAMRSNSTLLDEYDTMMDSLKPFWGLTAREIRARGEQLQDGKLAVFTVKNHTVSKTYDKLVLGGFSETISRWMHNHAALLPDMDVVINGLAEPAVIIPHDRLDHLIRTCPTASPQKVSTGTQMARGIEWMELGKKTSWQIGTRSCSEDSISRSRTFIAEDHALDLPFVRNLTSAKDWCSHPEAAYTHAMFTSPYNLKVTDTLTPMFSHGKPSSSQDILYPSCDYDTTIEEKDPQYKPPDDPPWENKTNQLYWAGSDTGGYAHGDGWKGFHRQRFVTTVTNTTAPVTFLRDQKSSLLSPHRWQPYQYTMADLQHLIDVKFTDVNLCDSRACSEERKMLPIGARDGKEVAFQHRFLFDVDGMGRTERYYRLLGSRSTVLKQTMYREWHDDRLVPWVHYVPVSLGMEELPELLRFLATEDSGQRISKAIAEQGRLWRETALRNVDLGVAFLRLLLEYGRLVSDEKDQKGLCPWDRITDEKRVSFG